MSEEPISEMPTVPQVLGRLRIALNASFSRASREVGLTPQQAELLCFLFAPRSIGELAGLLHCDRSNVSHLVDRATARDLLRREPDNEDGRVSRVALTDEGYALASSFIRRLERLTHDLRAGWTSERTTDATALLAEIAETLEDPTS